MSTNTEYIVIVEQAADGSLSAYVPDWPGCVSCGDSLDEVRSLISEAVAAHIDSMRNHGEEVPPPSAKSFAVKAA